jgi:hypothetical protein
MISTMVLPKHIGTSSCKGVSLEHLRHSKVQENSEGAISLLESKHADLVAAGRGSYVHAMAMTKTTREADLCIAETARAIHPKIREQEKSCEGIIVP